MPRIADEACLDGIPKTNPYGVDVELYSANRARLGKKLHIRERRTDHEQRIAVGDGSMRRLCSEKANSAGGIRTIVGKAGFTQERLDDRSGERFGKLRELIARAQSAAACQNGDF